MPLSHTNEKKKRGAPFKRSKGSFLKEDEVASSASIFMCRMANHTHPGVTFTLHRPLNHFLPHPLDTTFFQ